MYNKYMMRSYICKFPDDVCIKAYEREVSEPLSVPSVIYEPQTFLRSEQVMKVTSIEGKYLLTIFVYFFFVNEDREKNTLLGFFEHEEEEHWQEIDIPTHNDLYEQAKINHAKE